MIEGIDLSQWNAIKDWRVLKNAGIQFVILRATIATHLDKKFDEFYKRAKEFGFLIGAYHAWIPDRSPWRQAETILGALQDHPMDLPLFIDVEIPHPHSEHMLRENLLYLIATLRHLGLFEIGIYTSPSIAKTFRLDQVPNIQQLPLWIAHWNVKEPTVPAPWHTWAIWQYRVARTGEVPGTASKVDRNRIRPETLPYLLTNFGVYDKIWTDYSTMEVTYGA